MKLRLENVRVALESFEIEADVFSEGRVTAVFGPSGAGKTTLLEIVAGLRRPQRGRVSLGDNVFSDAAAGAFVSPEHRELGYVPQDGALFPHLSVRQNLAFGKRKTARQESLYELQHVIEVLELPHVIDRDVSKLSGGEAQRVALGRALLTAPKLLLLDEPLAGLDQPLKERLMPYLQRVRDEFKIPMLYVSHSPEEVVALCDEVLVLSSGRVVGRGPPEQIFERDESPRFKLSSRGLLPRT